jgi:hypothetical protein
LELRDGGKLEENSKKKLEGKFEGENLSVVE